MRACEGQTLELIVFFQLSRYENLCGFGTSWPPSAARAARRSRQTDPAPNRPPRIPCLRSIICQQLAEPAAASISQAHSPRCTTSSPLLLLLLLLRAPLAQLEQAKDLSPLCLPSHRRATLPSHVVERRAQQCDLPLPPNVEPLRPSSSAPTTVPAAANAPMGDDIRSIPLFTIFHPTPWPPRKSSSRHPSRTGIDGKAPP